jgi:hypothetical protein
MKNEQFIQVLPLEQATQARREVIYSIYLSNLSKPLSIRQPALDPHHKHAHTLSTLDRRFAEILYRHSTDSRRLH